MPSRNVEFVYSMLSGEPVKPNEVAKRLGVTHRTANDVLMHLVLTKDDVQYQNPGRIHLF